jgi:hypothetical protein
MVEPEALPIPDAPPEPEPESEDEEEDTAPQPEPVTPAAGPNRAPGAAGAQPMLDPFGRAIPLRGTADRPGRPVRRGGRAPAADEE